MIAADMAPILDAITPGDRIALAGSSGEPVALLDAWRSDPDRTRDLSILTCAVAGINRFDVSAWHCSSRSAGLFMTPACMDAFRAGRYHWLATSYGSFARRLLDRHEPIDTVVLSLSPPGPDGCHSLGLSAEFMPLLMQQARKILGIVNHAMPYVTSAPKIARDRLQVVCEIEMPLTFYDTGPVDPASDQISRLIADFVPDGAALQSGIGKVPAALAQALTGKRGLRLQSGMLGDGFRLLAEAGALDADWVHQGCAMVGSSDLYTWAVDRDDFAISGCEVTHHPGRLASIEHLVAVNSALEVDLFGQCNLEFAGGRPVSGCGGAPDFARAAHLSAGGLSIIALPATAAGGSVSRICDKLAAPGVTSLPRTDIDLVVTEHGVADLRGLAMEMRAKSLIAIAAPEFREELERAWVRAENDMTFKVKN